MRVIIRRNCSEYANNLHDGDFEPVTLEPNPLSNCDLHPYDADKQMVSAATDNGNTRHAVGMDQWRTMNSSGRIRATTEVNFKSIMRAFVFGEDPRVINPGDMLLEMSQSEPGDRDQKNVRKFEITINGNQMAGLLAQITRAADLYKVNQEWLSSPVTTTIEPTYQSVQQKYAEDMAKLDLQRIRKPAPKLSRAR